MTSNLHTAQYGRSGAAGARARCRCDLGPIRFAPDCRELSREPYGILKGVVHGKTFQEGTWGAEIVDALKPHADHIIVEGKRGLCGFATTNLDFILRGRGIRNVALGGFLTNCCVESTMRMAA
jgi:ureidoacrylate peracid hydrolase